MGRHKPLPNFDRWTVSTSPRGQWILTDQSGHPVLHHPDRLTRLRAVYLAAQAPPLLVAVTELLRVLERNLSGYHGYHPLVEFAHLTITLSRPPGEVAQAAEPVRDQQDLDLEAA